MSIGATISRLRTDANLSQEQFAELFCVSRQAVQKWESDISVPELEKLIKISKYFDISLDSLILKSNRRIAEELNYSKSIKPKYANINDWESYSSNLITEYRQATEEGLDIGVYADVFSAVSRLPKSEAKTKLGDVLFETVLNAEPIKGYKYNEPSDIEEIKKLRKPFSFTASPDRSLLKEKISGAWTGRACGCLLGQAVEGIKTDELIQFLLETNNYPLHRYILQGDLNDNILNKYNFRFAGRNYADKTDGMPIDDDTNYTVMAQQIIEKCGRDFTPFDVAHTWVSLQSKHAYCTAERVAFCNFIKGYEPPESAKYKNPYREWIGAQIRGDYFGYINPGDPETAAEMAFRDASVSHVKNGIYGEMYVAAMLAAAACTDNIRDIISAGLAQIPKTSRLYEAVTEVLTSFERSVSARKCFSDIHSRFNEHDIHDWCHTVSNAMIVTASLLYGNGDFGKSICMAVETGFDTDCNGATVGSVLGMALGIDGIDSSFKKPINGIIHTSLFGVGTVKISQLTEQTLKHIPKP